jgi:hypothetical protein
MGYRERAAPEREVLHTFRVSIPRLHLTSFLLVPLGPMACLVALSFAAADGAFGTLSAAILAFGTALAVIAAALFRWRTRSARVVRESGELKLEVERGPALAFPLRLRGTKVEIDVRNAKNWRIVLELRARDGVTLVLEEGWGTWHGDPGDWIGGLDAAPARPDYYCKPRTLARLRTLITETEE